MTPTFAPSFRAEAKTFSPSINSPKYKSRRTKSANWDWSWRLLLLFSRCKYTRRVWIILPKQRLRNSWRKSWSCWKKIWEHAKSRIYRTITISRFWIAKGRSKNCVESWVGKGFTPIWETHSRKVPNGRSISKRTLKSRSSTTSSGIKETKLLWRSPSTWLKFRTAS